MSWSEDVFWGVPLRVKTIFFSSSFKIELRNKPIFISNYYFIFQKKIVKQPFIQFLYRFPILHHFKSIIIIHFRKRQTMTIDYVWHVLYIFFLPPLIFFHFGVSLYYYTWLSCLCYHEYCVSQVKKKTKKWKKIFISSTMIIIVLLSPPYNSMICFFWFFFSGKASGAVQFL